MKIIIHRGTNQIGGCVTEISTSTTRIFIDFGMELSGEHNGVGPSKIAIDGLTSGKSNSDAVLFTHYHGDHIGMLPEILPEVPVYMGEAAKEFYYVLQKHIHGGIPDIVTKARTFKAGCRFYIKDIAITPLSIDHSAYDAYMFLIEADGRKILHTGDFRTHGFRGKGVIPAIEKYAGQVDVLITEGTMLSRDDTGVITEHELQNKARKLLIDYKYVFLICSSTNIDRLGAFHEATPRGKYFICDEYQMEIINIARKYGGSRSKLYQFAKALTYGSNLPLEDKGFCILVRNSPFFKKILNYYKDNHDEESILIYSMWDGYLKQPDNTIGSIIEGFNNVTHLHTSGHAIPQAILDLIRAVAIKQSIVPIHTVGANKLLSTEFADKVTLLKDGEEYILY